MFVEQGRVRSADVSHFAMAARSDIPRSGFSYSTGRKTTFDAGLLIPIFLTEILPGDSLRLKMSAFVRLATPIVPVMDNLVFESFFFFVPNRLVWSNWERFMGEQATITDTTEFLIPQVNNVAAIDTTFGTISDYFGIKNLNGAAATIAVSALPFRGLWLIYNDWFRDQDLVDPFPAGGIPLGDGPDAIATYQGGGLPGRGKRHDYFTSCRPWPLKPSPGGFASPGVWTGVIQPGDAFAGQSNPFFGIGAPVHGLGIVSAAPTAGPFGHAETGSRTATYQNYYDDATHSIRLKAQAAGNFPDVRVLVNDLRQAVMMQAMLERNARGGTRYPEIILEHFGVRSPDFRLQRPEYLGGGKQLVTVNPVAQTSATSGTALLGELAGVGSAAVSGGGHGFSSSFTEHGHVFGLVSVRADLTYQQGTARMWFRRNKWEFYWPGLAHLPEQPVLSREIYCDATAADLNVFGYNERWSEYRTQPSYTSGHFNSVRTTPIDQWHFGQEFSARPVLNDAFIREQPPITRVLQVDPPASLHSQFLCDALFDCDWVRCMPLFSLPGVGRTL